ncbi:MAG: DUF401 family protein [Thermoplasmatota archaeon]
MLDFLAIIAAFALLGFLIYRREKFGYSIMAAVGVLLLLSNPSREGLYWLVEISFEYDTLSLVSIIILIGFLGFLYKDTGQVMRMIKELRAAVPDRRWVIASIPALFGLMPMPGGALVSAPMIDEEGDYLNATGVQKTFMNWWFRHIWFTIYPLSLGLILASSISGISIYKIAMFNLPIFAVQIVIGVIWGVGDIDELKGGDTPVSPLVLVWEISPIILALVLNIFLGIPFYITLLMAIILLLFQNRDRYDLDDIPDIIESGFSKDLLLASLGIMLFKGIIERTGAIGPVVNSLQEYIPLLAVVIIVAVAVGLLFGHLPGAVGIGFPVLISIVPDINLLTVGLIFLFIFIGYLISPIHLCIILTIEYFKTDLASFYKKAAVPAAVLIIAIVAWLVVTGAMFAV